MAGRKKGPHVSPPPTPEGERAFAVVVEQLRGDFKVFGEALGGVREEVGGLREEVGGLHKQVGGLREELGGVRKEVGDLREDVGGLHKQVGGLREELGGLREEVGGLRQQMTDGFAAVDRRFERVERDLGDVKVDLALVKSAVTVHTRELREIRSALGNKVERGEVEAIATHVVTRIAQR